MIINFLLLVAFAKANQNFDRPWHLSGIYTGLTFLISALISSFSISLLVACAINFVLIGFLLKLLYDQQDTIFNWLLILIGGALFISFWPRLLS